MTKKQSVALMNLLAEFIGYIHKFSLPFQLIHGLVGYEEQRENIYKSMTNCLEESEDADAFLEELQNIKKNILSANNQMNMLMAYHVCIWMDRMLTYEDLAKGKLSIYELVPLRAYSYVAVDALNDNYRETGIWINPKLPIFKTSMVLEDGTERERSVANRDAFAGINGELRNICYFQWNKRYIVHNVLLPYEYREADGINAEAGKLRVGFVPVSDQTNLIVPEYENSKEGKYELKKMFIHAPNHGEIIERRLKRGLELACENEVDIVFAPEMLGTIQTEQCKGNYNEFVRSIYGYAVMIGRRPPLITVMPSYWHEGINSASIVYRDGRVLGRQKKQMPYVDYRSCAAEGLRLQRVKEVFLLHVYGVHRIMVSICAEFLDGFEGEFLCGQLGVTFVIVPSYSHGERDFVNKLGAFFPYGTSVVWGDCCGAVTGRPKVIGGCSLVGSNEICKMGDNCKCSFSCGSSTGCLFMMDLPLKILYTKDVKESHKPIQHILS